MIVVRLLLWIILNGSVVLVAAGGPAYLTCLTPAQHLWLIGWEAAEGVNIWMLWFNKYTWPSSHQFAVRAAESTARPAAVWRASASASAARPSNSSVSGGSEDATGPLLPEHRGDIHQPALPLHLQHRQHSWISGIVLASGNKKESPQSPSPSILIQVGNNNQTSL